MATNKKSVLLYCDIIHTVEKLDDKTAGELFKHYLRYINDLNPQTENMMVEIAFESIRQNLKRDLIKWENRAEQSRINGTKGGRPEKPKKPTGLNRNPKNPSEPEKPVKVTVTVKDTVKGNVNDTVIDINSSEYRRIFLRKKLSEISISQAPDKEKDYLDPTVAFWKLFIFNLEEEGISTEVIKKANCGWIQHIRLLVESDGHDKKAMRKVFKFLQVAEWWKRRCMSTAYLRRNFTKILMQANEKPNSKNRREPVSDDFKKRTLEKLFGTEL